MNAQQIISQTTAQIPECPAYQVNAYLNEFLESIKNSGKDVEVALVAATNQGYSAEIPDNVLTISDLYINGRRAISSMSEERAMEIMYQYPDDETITDENDDAITDDHDDPMEV